MAALIALLTYLWLRLSLAVPGETFWHFVVLYGASVLVLDAFHAISPTWMLGIRIPQVVALLALLCGLYVLSYYAYRREEKQATAGPRPSTTEAS